MPYITAAATHRRNVICLGALTLQVWHLASIVMLVSRALTVDVLLTARRHLQFAPQAEAILTAGDPVKNARAILRNALPIENKPVRKIQRELESVAEALRIPGSKSLNPITRSVRTAESTLQSKEKEIVAAFAKDKKEDGQNALNGLKTALKEFDEVIKNQDKQEVPIIQQKCLRYVGAMEEAMVQKFPFEVRSHRG